jgi:hypothetical protein
MQDRRGAVSGWLAVLLAGAGALVAGAGCESVAGLRFASEENKQVTLLAEGRTALVPSLGLRLEILEGWVYLPGGESLPYNSKLVLRLVNTSQEPVLLAPDSVILYPFYEKTAKGETDRAGAGASWLWPRKPRATVDLLPGQAATWEFVLPAGLDVYERHYWLYIRPDEPARQVKVALEVDSWSEHVVSRPIFSSSRTEPYGPPPPWAETGSKQP